MSDLDSRWLKYPEIGFDHDRVLTVNKHIVELSDISGIMLSDYIEIGREQIDTQLAIIENNREFRAEPKNILVGRLAIKGFEYTAFTLEGIKTMNDKDLKGEHLLQNYQIFWHMIRNASYTPVIERQAYSHQTGLNGTWLGLERP